MGEMSEQKFFGPVFIFGMPRSGTKLLRDLLNRNEKISIPVAESHFIPYFVDKYGFDFDLTLEENRKKIYKEFINTSYCFFLKQLHIEFEQKEFLYSRKINRWADLFEYLLRKGGQCLDKKEVIFGDKTPGYIRHMSLLKKVFPQCKFIHIIRDPRDYALSSRKAWKKNIYRAAERWRETLERFDEDSQNMSEDDISVVYYEEMLEHPEQVMRRLCSFLGVEYTSDMLRLEKSWEFYGDARSKTEIVRHNKEKYLKELKEKEIKRIEEIVYSSALKHSYTIHFAVRPVPLRGPEMMAYKFFDFAAIIRHNIEKYGLFKGLYLSYIHHKKSSWQN